MSELEAVSTVTLPHTWPTLTLKEKSHTAPLSSFTSRLHPTQQSKGFATNFPRSTDFPAAREGPMTKPVRSQKRFSTYNLTFCYALSLPCTVPSLVESDALEELFRATPSPGSCLGSPALWSQVTQMPKLNSQSHQSRSRHQSDEPVAPRLSLTPTGAATGASARWPADHTSLQVRAPPPTPTAEPEPWAWSLETPHQRRYHGLSLLSSRLCSPAFSIRSMHAYPPGGQRQN